MRLPIIDSADRPVELDGIRISGLRPIHGPRRVLDVRRDEREQGSAIWRYALRDAAEQQAADEHRDGDDPGDTAALSNVLDARIAAELASAVRRLVERTSSTGLPDTGIDDMELVITIRWGGIEHHYVVADLDSTVDEALEGVLSIASTLAGARAHVSEVEFTEHADGGDPACWQHLVCENCGLIHDAGQVECRQR